MSWTTRPQSVQETSGSESSLCEDWVLQSKLLPDHAQLTSKGGATAAAEAHSSRLCLGSCFGSCLFRFLDHRSIGLPLVYTNCELPQWKLNVLVQRSQQDISSTKTGMKTWHYISFGQTEHEENRWPRGCLLKSNIFGCKCFEWVSHLVSFDDYPQQSSCRSLILNVSAVQLILSRSYSSLPFCFHAMFLRGITRAAPSYSCSPTMVAPLHVSFPSGRSMGSLVFSFPVSDDGPYLPSYSCSLFPGRVWREGR